MNTFFRTITLVFAITGLFAAPSAADTAFDNSSALRGLENVQVYFDVSVKDDNLLLLRMKLADRTIKTLKESGLDVTSVIGFRGGVSRFITQDDHYVLEEEFSNKRKIQEWVKQFSSQGVVIEQCAIAAEILDIPAEDFLPDIKMVGNGYISLVGYQAQGYSVVPMD